MWLRWPVILLSLIATLNSPLAFAEPVIEIELSRPADTAKLFEESGRTVILITSKSGIGQMTLKSKDGTWPKDVTLRLRYENKQPFKTLEGFDMTSSRLQIRSNSGQTGKAPFFLADAEGKFSRDDLNPSGWLNLIFKPHEQDLDVIFPAHLWRDEKQVHLQWIDFYR